MAQLKAVNPVIMSSDVAKTIKYLAGFGFELDFQDDEGKPMYAGVCRDGLEIHIQWNDLSVYPAGTDRPTTRFIVDSVDELAAEFRGRGVERVEPFDTGWGTREMHFQDQDRNGYQFYMVR